MLLSHMEQPWLMPKRLCLCVGTSIEKLRSQVLARAAAEGVGRVSANEIMSAVLWIMRYLLRTPF